MRILILKGEQSVASQTCSWSFPI